MSTTAATINRVFLLPPAADLSVLLTLPPKVNAGAGADVPSPEEMSALMSETFSAGLSGVTVDDLTSATVPGFVSRAGAGALAAPDPIPAELADDRASGRLAAIFVSGAANCGETIEGETIEGETTGAETKSSLTSRISASLSAVSFGIDATTLGCAGFGVGILAVAALTKGLTGTAGRGATLVFGAGVIGACVIDGGETGFGGADTDFAAAADAGVAGFPASFLRKSPRATRSVPFACSTLIGLVRTRFAPIRNAFATPACPSTTATARDDWLAGVFRALLNNNVAFCSLSQSTTTASKCSPINFLTAPNGSVQGLTVKSNSLRTCVTARAVFSSGQNKSA